MRHMIRTQRSWRVYVSECARTQMSNTYEVYGDYGGIPAKTAILELDLTGFGRNASNVCGCVRMSILPIFSAGHGLLNDRNLL